MKATPIIDDRYVYEDGTFAEIVVWKVPSVVPPSKHGFKYRLAYIVGGRRVVGFDNERGKGDHQHIDGNERPYAFDDVAQLMTDFAGAVEKWRAINDRRR